MKIFWNEAQNNFDEILILWITKTMKFFVREKKDNNQWRSVPLRRKTIEG